MAIGARITSTNLSGKTATVTFTPYTGQVSGTTVNLGSKIIPFNNITPHPYGEYAIYLAEYDYTYTLNIPEPAGDTQTFVYVDRMSNSNNYGAALLNFSDFTAEVIDLGVDSTYWNNNTIRPLQNSGYMHLFDGDSNYQEKLVIFTDVSGLEIGRYTGTTNNYNSNSLDGRVVFFEDETNGVLTYSNGTSVHNYTWNPTTHYIDVEWDWYGVTSDNTIIIKKYEISEWNFNGNGESYLINTNDGTSTLFKTWSDGTFIRHKMQPNTNFIVVETENQSLTGNTYTNLEICDTSGGILESISLTGALYNSRRDDFLGTTKYCVCYYNYDDVNVDYKIIHYNGTTLTLTQTSHVMGLNYPSMDMLGDDNFWPNNSSENGAVVMSFYRQAEYSVFGTAVDYCDIVYMLDNQTTFNTYEVANNTQAVVETYGQLSNIYRTKISTNGFVEILTISTTGGTITTTAIPISGITNLNTNFIGDRTIYTILSNGNVEINVLLIDVDGTIMDTLSKTLSSDYNYSTCSRRNLGYVRLGTIGGDEGYYVYSGSTSFTSTGVYNNWETSDTYYADNFLRPEFIFLFAQGGINARILSSTGITSEFVIPELSNYNVRVGRDKIMIVYQDINDNNYVKINLYNSSGTLLNNTATEYNYWDESFGVKDRFVVKFNGQGENYYYLISEQLTTLLVLSSYDTEWAVNDYIFWDDF